MDADKMTTEKFETRKPSTVESGYGDLDETVEKRALWKMDIRYALPSSKVSHLIHDLTSPRPNRLFFLS